LAVSRDATFRTVMAVGPEYPRAPQGGAGRNDDALARAVSALNSQRPRDAELIAGELLKAEPRHIRALHIFGCALLMQGRAEDAIAPLESAARGRHDPEINTQLAIALRQAGRDDEALPRLKRAIKQQPPYPPAFRELGALLFAMERHDEAIEALNRGLDVAPMMPDLSIQLGYVFLQIKDAAGAKSAFARALNISPSAADALFGMAKAHRDAGENAAAADYFRRYLVSTPGDSSVWLYLGHCLLDLGQFDAGCECFRTAARGDPKRYGNALSSLAASGRGRFWLKPSAAAHFMRGAKS
jgi:tetratricopeptide (TPR) repeat protein